MSLCRWYTALMLQIVVTVSGCGNSTPTGPGPLTPLTVADFPLSVGSHWVYHVVDTVTDQEDTVDVVISSEQFDTTGAHVTTWLYSSRNDVFYSGSDTDIVLALGDSIFFYACSCSKRPYRKIVFPVTDYATWTYSSAAGYDSSWVSGQTVVRTPQRPFHAYEIQTTTLPMALDLYLRASYSVSRDFGLVHINRTVGFHYMVKSVQLWHLLSVDSPWLWEDAVPYVDGNSGEA